MIGTSRAEYCFICFCIFCLHYFAPLCILYCVFVIATYGFEATTRPFPLIIEVLAAAETLFFLLVYLPYRYHLQKPAIHPPAHPKEVRQALFEMCRQNLKDPEEYIKKWFLNAELENIKRDNLKEFYLWAFFDRGGPAGDDDEELEAYVTATEELLDRKLEPGKGDAKPLRLTLDRVEMLHRSLVWYFCVGFVDLLTYMSLLYHGFRFHRTSYARLFTNFPFRLQTLFSTHKSPAKHTTYWSRPHTSKTELPVIFVHGIGIGLYPYTHFLNELNSTAGVESSDPNNQIGIIAIEIMPVSFRITHPALRKDELCDEIDKILLQHFSPDQKFVLASHSYGTVISTHLLKTPRIASRIGPIVLIDPVSILLHLPDVAYNFTRRQPKRANEHQLYYFACMDMCVSHTLSRQFFWNENILWKEDIAGRRVTVCLSERDLIVNTRAVAQYLLSDRLDNKNMANVAKCSSRDSESVLEAIEGNPEMQPLLNAADEATGDEAWKTMPWEGTDIDVLWFEDKDHAQVFDTPVTRKRIIDVVRKYCLDE